MRLFLTHDAIFTVGSGVGEGKVRHTAGERFRRDNTRDSFLILVAERAANSYAFLTSNRGLVRSLRRCHKPLNKNMKRIIALLALTAALPVARAEESFLQLSLTPDIAIQSRETHIKGISLNIWGENPQSSFTLGLVNGSTGESKGFSWGLYNYCEDYTGVHLGWSITRRASSSAGSTVL